jgi:DNA-binding MarR family transcriptional regulator
MKQQECEKEVLYTKKHYDILDYISCNGCIAVEIAASTLGQNKNFYSRVQKLENQGLINVIREDGRASLFTITTKGEKVYEALRAARENKGNRFPFTIEKDLLTDLIKDANIDEITRYKLLSILQ